MTPRDAFGVVVRTIGLLMLIGAVWMTVTILNLVGFSGKLFLYLIFQVAPTAALGFWMLRGPALVIDFAYPPNDQPPSPSNDPGEHSDAGN